MPKHSYCSYFRASQGLDLWLPLRGILCFEARNRRQNNFGFSVSTSLRAHMSVGYFFSGGSKPYFLLLSCLSKQNGNEIQAWNSHTFCTFEIFGHLISYTIVLAYVRTYKTCFLIFFLSCLRHQDTYFYTSLTSIKMHCWLQFKSPSRPIERHKTLYPDKDGCLLVKNTVTSWEIQTNNDHLLCFIFYSLGWENVRTLFFSPPSMSRDRHSLPRWGHTQVSRQHACIGRENIMVSCRPLKKLRAHKGGGGTKKSLCSENHAQFVAFHAGGAPGHGILAVSRMRKCRILTGSRHYFFSLFTTPHPKSARCQRFPRKKPALTLRRKIINFIPFRKPFFYHVSILACGEAY